MFLHKSQNPYPFAVTQSKEQIRSQLQYLLTKYDLISDVARPLSYNTKTTFKTKTAFFKDHQINNPRPQKRSLAEKNQARYAGFAQSCRNYAGNQKKPAYYVRAF